MPESTTLSPRTARFQRSAAAALAAATAPAPAAAPPGPASTNSQGTLDDLFQDEGGRPQSPQVGEKRSHVDSGDEGDNPRTRLRLADNSGADLSAFLSQAARDHKLSAAAAGRLERFSKASTVEQLFMIFLNTELILSKMKDVAEDWEVPAPLKVLCRTRIVACFLSPHIPEYRRNLHKHVMAMIPPQSKHLLPDETLSVHRGRFKTFISEYATTVRNSIKKVLEKSMTRSNPSRGKKGKDVVDVEQGWCIGRLCEAIVAKLGTDADIQITTQVQSRIALLRFVYTSYPERAAGNGFWNMVDETLADQRKLEPAALAHDIVNGLNEDIKKFTVDSDQAYALVSADSVGRDSMQAAADKAMRDYYKTVQPKRSAGSD